MSGGSRSRPQRPRAPSGIRARSCSGGECRCVMHPNPADSVRSHDARDSSRAGSRPAAAGAAAGKLTVARILSRPRRLSAASSRHPSHGSKRRWCLEASETRGRKTARGIATASFPLTQRGGLAHAAAGRAPAREPESAVSGRCRGCTPEARYGAARSMTGHGCRMAPACARPSTPRSRNATAAIPPRVFRPRVSDASKSPLAF